MEEDTEGYGGGIRRRPRRDTEEDTEGYGGGHGGGYGGIRKGMRRMIPVSSFARKAKCQVTHMCTDLITKKMQVGAILEQVARVPKLMQNASFICVVVGAFSHIFLQIFNSIHIFLQYSIQLSRNPYSP